MVCIFLLFGCTGTEEEPGDFKGVINTGNTMGYEYTVIKEENQLFVWKIGYKGKETVIKESQSNREDLESFMHAVNDVEIALVELIIWSVYFLLIMFIAIFCYIKKFLKEASVAFIVFGMIAIWLSFSTFLDLNKTMQTLKYHYMLLT